MSVSASAQLRQQARVIHVVDVFDDQSIGTQPRERGALDAHRPAGSTAATASGSWAFHAAYVRSFTSSVRVPTSRAMTVTP